MLRAFRTLRGFTLIEAMVSLAILSALIALGAPSLASYSENSKVRGIAESFYASAQQARLEAIRTNQRVQLILTTDAPTAANVSTTNTSATAGSWMVRRMSDDATPVYTFVEGKNIREGSNRSDGTSSVTVAAASSGAALASITFSGTGTASLTAPWTVNFGSSTGACATAGPVKCLRVVVSPGGQVKACDPAATAAGDTRRCS